MILLLQLSGWRGNSSTYQYPVPPRTIASEECSETVFAKVMKIL